jgi:cysteine-rich repeat protein
MCSSSTICTLCDATSYFQLSTGATQCSCLTGYYFNSPARNCVSCVTLSPSCNSCSSSNICLSCSNGFSLLTGMCICPSCNYIDIATGTCLPCPATCPTCASLTSCSSCISGYSLSATTCSEICGDGRLFILQCDDGNTVDGDGCSHNC